MTSLARMTALLIMSMTSQLVATSYVMMKDADLADQAESIVLGTVTSRETGLWARPITRYRVDVEEFLKGSAPSQSVTVDVMGGESADGTLLVLFDSPGFRVGDRVILFLVSRPDGSLAILHLSLGAFTEMKSGTGQIAYRNIAEAADLSYNSETSRQFNGQQRGFEKFYRWLADRSQGDPRPMDYFVSGQSNAVVNDFSISGFSSRIFDFDNGGTVEWRIHQDGQPGLTGGGTTEFENAIAAWNGVPDASVNYTVGGYHDGDGRSRRGWSQRHHLRRSQRGSRGHLQLHLRRCPGAGRVHRPWTSPSLRRTKLHSSHRSKHRHE